MKLRKRACLGGIAVVAVSGLACGQSAALPAGDNPLAAASLRQPWEVGATFEGGTGVTDQRGGFRFLYGGVQAGRVLTNNFGHGFLRGNFEYGVQVLPYWEALTPKFQRIKLTPIGSTGIYSVSQPYTVGGTYHGVSLVPIILRWNFARHGHLVPWAQAAGGLVYTTHKFPAYGNLDPTNIAENGPNGETSVWNFTPQGGVGLHYFTSPKHSIDLSANGVHLSSASLGDRNPGVNASVQFSLGYTWWK